MTQMQKESKMKTYQITVKLKKPFTLVDKFPKYPSRDLILDNFIDAITHHELDEDLEIEIIQKNENTEVIKKNE